MAETSKAVFFTQAQMDAAVKVARSDGKREGVCVARDFLLSRADDLDSATDAEEWSAESALLRWAASRINALP